MKAHTIVSRIALVFVSMCMLALSATLAWAAVIDYQTRGLVPKGVTLVGRDLSGMTESQVRAAIEESISTPLMRPVTVTGDKKTWTLDPKGIVSVDVESMFNAAYVPRRTAPLVSRLDNQLRDKLLPADIKPAYSVDATVVAAWVAQTAKQVDRKPVNATRKLVKYALKVTPERYGAKVVQTRSAQAIAQALTADVALATESRVVTLPIYVSKPKVLRTSFKLAIVVSLSHTRIWLFRGDKVVKTYRCAPGQPAYPTPTGDFKVESKLADAPWINPHAPWSSGMPDMIPAGPDNPMGVRKIGINVPGVYFHGVPPGEFGSIGSHASHACMRMMPDDVMDLYGRVKIGTPVFIRE